MRTALIIVTIALGLLLAAAAGALSTKMHAHVTDQRMALQMLEEGR